MTWGPLDDGCDTTIIPSATTAGTLTVTNLGPGPCVIIIDTSPITIIEVGVSETKQTTISLGDEVIIRDVVEGEGLKSRGTWELSGL